MKLMEISGSTMNETPGGDLSKEKVLLLIEGDSYAVMEAVATDYINSRTDYKEHTHIDSIKEVKSTSLYFNAGTTIDDEVENGLQEWVPESKDGSFWQVVVSFFEEIEGKGGKVTTKTTKDTYIVVAEKANEAVQFISDKQRASLADWEITAIKQLKTTAALILQETTANLYEAYEIDRDLIHKDYMNKLNAEILKEVKDNE